MDVTKVRGGYRARLELFEAIRPTAAQARAALTADIETALAQCRRVPAVIDGGGSLIGIVWADPGGYNYSILTMSEAPSGTTIPSRSFCAFDTFEDAERALRSHLAQYRFDPEDPADYAWLITNPRDKAQHLDWVRWQRAYADARKRGLSNEEARAYATEFRYPA